jgi:hypothetical protein
VSCHCSHGALSWNSCGTDLQPTCVGIHPPPHLPVLHRRVFRAVEWLLFRVIIVPKGYATYVTVMYVLAGIVGLTVVTTAWVAIALKGDDTGNVWLRRLVFLLQLLALLTYSLFPYAILDVFSFMLDCSWGNISAGLPVLHLHFTEQRKAACVQPIGHMPRSSATQTPSDAPCHNAITFPTPILSVLDLMLAAGCLAMPHLVHMLFAGAMCIVFCGLMLVMVRHAAALAFSTEECQWWIINLKICSQQGEVVTIR